MIEEVDAVGKRIELRRRSQVGLRVSAGGGLLVGFGALSNLVGAVSLRLLIGLLVLAQNPSAHAQQLVENSSSSGSANGWLIDAPEPVSPGASRGSGVRPEYQTNLRRFSHVAGALSVGSQGIEVQLATPLSNKWNLRGGVGALAGSYSLKVNDSSAAANFNVSLTNTAIDVNVQPHFKTAAVMADWFPWYGSFRVSPGLTVYNGNRATVLATVEGGQELDVGAKTYVSDPADPIVATLRTRLGRTVAPRLTVGWGNMIPRRGEHFSFPLEVGVEYAGRPQLTLALSGSECDPDGRCYPVSADPKTQANVLDEQRTLNQDIAPLRFYPILSTGVSYRF